MDSWTAGTRSHANRCRRPGMLLGLSIGVAAIITAAVQLSLRHTSGRRGSSRGPSQASDPYTALFNANTVGAKPPVLNTTAPAVNSTDGLSTFMANATPEDEQVSKQSVGEMRVDGEPHLPEASPTPPWLSQLSQTRTACFPRDGNEFVDAMLSESCRFVYLTKPAHGSYVIRDIINVTHAKVIVGDPIALPLINGSETTARLFDVYAGGSLDVRSVQLLRGKGRSENNVTYNFGNTARIHPGGHFACTGCIFRQKKQTVESFLKDLKGALTDRELNFGAHVLVLGGDLHLTGCWFLGSTPFGAPTFQRIRVGGDILIVAGNGVSIGVYHTFYTLFQNSFRVGNRVAVLGGTYTWIGGSINTVNGAQSQWHLGGQIFVGGGVLVSIGAAYTPVTGIYVRGGMGVFTVAGGVHLMFGFNHARVYGAMSGYVFGKTYAVGTGIFRWVGGARATVAGLYHVVGQGVTAAVGSGTLSWIGVVNAASTMLTSQSGMGHTFFVNDGYIELIYTPRASANLLSSNSGLGTAVAMNAGLLVYVNNPSVTYELANAFFGRGSSIWIGAGTGVFVNNSQTSARLVSYSTTNYTYTVSGVGVGSDKASMNIVVDGDGVHRSSKGQGGASANSIVIIGDRVEDRQLNLTHVQAEALPTSMLAARGLFDVWRGITTDRPDTGRTPNVSLSMDTRCFVCTDAESPVGGQSYGAEQCQVQTGCTTDSDAARYHEALKRSFDGLPAVPPLAWTPTPTPDHADSLPDIQLMWHELVTYCTAGETPCLRSSGIKQALKTYTGLPLSFAFAVADASRLHKVVEMVAVPGLMESMTPQESQQYPNWSKFNVYTSTKDTDDQAAAEMAWLEMEADTSGILEALRRQLSEESGVQLGQVALIRKLSTTYSPMARFPGFNHQAAGVIGPAIFVVSDTALTPMTVMEAGNEYTVLLKNFPAGLGSVEVVTCTSLLRCDSNPLLVVEEVEHMQVTRRQFKAPVVKGRRFVKATQRGTALPVYSTALNVV